VANPSPLQAGSDYFMHDNYAAVESGDRSGRRRKWHGRQFAGSRSGL